MTVPARGSDADFCERFPETDHSFVHRKPAHSPVFIKICTNCGWIDGSELARDIQQLIEQLIPGVTGPCTRERLCPKALDPAGTSWAEGCWAYRNQEYRCWGGTDDRPPVATETLADQTPHVDSPSQEKGTEDATER